ncbi:MAG: YdiU family protein [Fimbriiglobus sp.]|nr:YdiU family protein [Fimbriiglobus sp.]
MYADSIGWNFDNTYARLPDDFFAPAKPAAVKAPKVVLLNHRLAGELGLDLRPFHPDSAAAVFAGQELPPGSQPIAQAYAGHQFGGFTMLGDGRAILLGEHRTPSGQLFDIQFKGSGPTLYSRRGDGRAGLGPMLREYIISEAMAALGIPTTRSLAVVTTGEAVFRAQVQRGAVLTRVAASHLRVGTFQYAAARRNEANLRTLADYAIARHYPEFASATDKYLAFLRAVADRQAALIAKWMGVGFVHGVMNTDNVSIAGETIDYGPCAFMNTYDPATVFSSIDHSGRYALANQPGITQWNLARLAESLLTLIADDENKSVELASEVLNEFPAVYQRYWLAGMRAKLGLQTEEADDEELVNGLLSWMHAGKADFTGTFRDLGSPELLIGERYQSSAFQTWHAKWTERLAREGDPSAAFARMNTVNPAYIPRNKFVEEALAAAERDDLAPLHELLAVLADPFTVRPEWAKYQIATDDRGYQTFCGT